MLSKGLDPNKLSIDGDGLLATALRNYQEPELVAELLKRGADPRQLVDGQPAFQYAVRYEYSEAYLNPLLDAMAKQ
jgi:ankyrin repeat protein